jgi:hypothetical protein
VISIEQGGEICGGFFRFAAWCGYPVAGLWIRARNIRMTWYEWIMGLAALLLFLILQNLSDLLSKKKRGCLDGCLFSEFGSDPRGSGGEVPWRAGYEARLDSEGTC